MDPIQAQRELSDKDLVIFNAELQRQSKSPIVAYVLWFLFGGLGVHNFYMGQARWGRFYLGLTMLGWALIIAGLADKQKDSPLLPIGVFALTVLAILLLWDLITIPRQLRQRQERIKQELLFKLGAKTSSAENAIPQYLSNAKK
jgi:ABC-type transport system involved in multi-copper enzyme maturation permease subunit